MVKIIFLLLFFVFNKICFAQKNGYSYKGAGFINYKRTYPIGMFTVNQITPSYVWYKDSFTIEKITIHETYTNINNITIDSFALQYYRFNDLRYKTMYFYPSFSDTSICMEKHSTIYVQNKNYHGGFNFYVTRKIHNVSLYKEATDTMIDGVRGKYMILATEANKNKEFLICLFNCEKEWPLVLDATLSSETGCSLIKVMHKDSSFSNLTFETEIEILSNTLSIAEHKVFTSWIEYANNNPVTKNDIRLERRMIKRGKQKKGFYRAQ